MAKKDLPMVVIKMAKKKPAPAKVDSMMVGGKKQAVKDVSRALATANKSNTAKPLVKGVSVVAPLTATKKLAVKSSTSDVVNKIIDNSKKKPNLMAKRK